MTRRLLITLCLSTLLAPVSVAAQSEAEIRSHITGKAFETRRMGMTVQMTFMKAERSLFKRRWAHVKGPGRCQGPRCA